MGDNR